ncbi:MAG: hypothetical protein JO149_09190, partial [Gammaproteobacteria bacterium]|nr:hypothetical protein [Gammaproteobacteria bacterium]
MFSFFSASNTAHLRSKSEHCKKIVGSVTIAGAIDEVQKRISWAEKHCSPLQISSS